MKLRVRSGLRLLAAALPALLLGPSASAERMHGSPQGRGHHQVSRVQGNTPGLNKHNNAARGGHSIHGQHRGKHHGHRHHGRPLWANGVLWYEYPETGYAYATTYVYRYLDEPAVSVASPPVEIGPAMQYWSFCEASRAYFPNVATCPGGWKQVQVPLSDTSPVR